jgi:ribulose-phosphate 3-epimerase
MPETLLRLKTIHEFLKEQNFDVVIEVDGGVNDKNLKNLIDLNVDSVVMGNFLYTCKNLKNTISNLKNIK